MEPPQMLDPERSNLTAVDLMTAGQSPAEVAARVETAPTPEVDAPARSEDDIPFGADEAPTRAKPLAAASARTT